MERRRFKHMTSLAYRLAQFAKAHREAANRLKPSHERDELMKKVSQAEVAFATEVGPPACIV